MASLINTFKNGAGNFTGAWEDIQGYNTVKINCTSPQSGRVILYWSNARNGPVLETDIVPYNVAAGFPVSRTFEIDAKTRWFKMDFSTTLTNSTLYSDNSINIEVLYKDAPTSIKITDSDTACTVDTGHLYTVLVDQSGQILGSTGTVGGEALYTHLRDASSKELATVPGNESLKSLATALRVDAKYDSVLVKMTDSSGISQAGTRVVAGAYRGGPALYLGTDIGSTTRSAVSSNALYVHATNESGLAYSSSNPLAMVVAGGSSSQVYPFDISTGITSTWSTRQSLKGRGKIIHNLYAYNDGPTVTWLKVYDLSVNNDTLIPRADIYDLEPYLMQSIPLMPGRTLDITYPNGIQFNNGVAFRATIDHTLEDTTSPGDDVVYIAGTYTDTTLTAAMTNTAISGWGSEENRLYEHNQSSRISPLELTLTRDPITVDGVWTFRWTDPSQYVGTRNYDVSAVPGEFPRIVITGASTSTGVTLADSSVSFGRHSVASLANGHNYLINVTNVGSVSQYSGQYDASGYYYSMLKNDMEIFKDVLDASVWTADAAGYLRLKARPAVGADISLHPDIGDFSYCAISGAFGSHAYMTVSGTLAPVIISDGSINIFGYNTGQTASYRYNIADFSFCGTVVTPFDGSMYTCIMRSVETGFGGL